MSELEENQNIDNHENEEREYNETQNSQTQNDNGMSKTQPLGKKKLPPIQKKNQNKTTGMGKTMPNPSSEKNMLNLMTSTDSINTISNNDKITMNKNLQEEENLKQELIFAKMDLNRKNQELYEFKIQFKKQLDDNRINKKLIERVLKIDPNKPCTKNEARDKVENARPTEEERKELKEAYESILLKAEIMKCKKEYNSKFAEYEKITKNAKRSNIIKLNSEITLKEEDIRKLNRKMKKMQEQLEYNEKVIDDLKKEYDYYKDNMKEVKKNMEESKKEEAQEGEKYEEKMNEIQELEKKLSEKEYEIKEKEKSEKKKNDEIKDLNKKVKLMEDFNEAKEGIKEKQNQDEEEQKKKKKR